MFNEISFYTLGRKVKTKDDWDFISLVPTNRLYYIHSGSVLHSSGNKKRVLSAGKMYLFPQNLTFELTLDSTTRIDHTYFNFCSVPLISAPDIIEIDLSEYPLLSSASSTLFMLAEESKKRKKLIKSYLNNLLVLINEEFRINLVRNKVIDNATAFIHANLSEKLSVSDIANNFNFEKSVFIKKFKKHMGVTPYQYIKAHRVNTAVALMNSSSLSAAEIAERVGYADAPSLYHAIKTRTDK